MQFEEIEMMPDHSGEDYNVVLEKFHNFIEPASYLEIGTLSGATLSLAKCPAISIDPFFQIEGNIMRGKKVLHLMQMKSDDFFKSHDPIAILGRKIEFAFLDGMHYCEYLLRDFINVEKYCDNKSIIAIHDCIPTDHHVARRYQEDTTLAEYSKHPGWWAGDVWKVIAILKVKRPNLKIKAYNARPTGLVVVSNLDPCNTVLSDSYFDIIQTMHSSEMNLGKFLREINLEDTEEISTDGKISRFYSP